MSQPLLFRPIRWKRIALVAALALDRHRRAGQGHARLLFGRQPGRLPAAILLDRHDVRRGVRADVQPAGPVRHRHHQRRAGARRVLDGVAGRQGVHVQAAQGCQVPQQRQLQADARHERRRRDLQLGPDGQRQEPVPRRHRRPDLRVLRRHGHEEHRREGREGRPDDGALHAEAARGAVPGRHGDGLRVDPVARVFRDDGEERHAQCRGHLPDRHRSVRVRVVPEGRDDPLQGLRPVLGRTAEGRQPRLLDHARRHGALREAEDRRVPRDGVPEARRPRSR